LLPIAGVICAWLITEIGLRIYWAGGPDRHYDTASPAESGRWSGHPFLPYAGQPNAVFELKNDDGSEELIETNSYGFRAPEFPTGKGPQDYFVLCFGGSTTYGYKAPSNALTWPGVLQRKLAAAYPERNVQVFNLGIDMATTAVSLVNLALVGVHVHPDLVIVYHGYNDLAALGSAVHRTDHSHFYSDLDPESVFRGYQSALPRWLRYSYVLFAVTGALDHMYGVNDLARTVSKPYVPDQDRLRGLDTTLMNFRTMHSIATGAGAEILFSTFQFRDGLSIHRQLNDSFREFFRKEGYRWVDQEVLIADGDPSINVDECHFTQKGRDMMATNFFDAIVAAGLVESSRAGGGQR
jgi:hypothetical protein